MEGEINNFIIIWISSVASLCYCHSIGKIISPGTSRLLALLPIICLFLIFPLNLTSMHLGGPTSFFLPWLANFKLLLFAFGKGPLSSSPPLSLPTFIPIACLPIKITPNLEYPSPQNQNKQYPVAQITQKFQKSALNYAVKVLLLATFVPVYDQKQHVHPKLIMFLYCIYLYVGLEIVLAIYGALARTLLGVELEPQFNEPYLSTSLQDFWGKRWNLMVTGILRPTVYDPVRLISSRWIQRKWAPLPAVLATFFVSGMMHELIFYYLGRAKPTWELTYFFLLHGVCLAIEIAVKKELNGKWGLPTVVSGPVTTAFVVVTGLWLFFPSLLRCEADVKAHRETIAWIEFVRSGAKIFRFKAKFDVMTN